VGRRSRRARDRGVRDSAVRGVCWRTVVRRMRGDGRAWKEIAAELGVAPSTAIWLAGRYRTEGQPSARRAILATLGCAGLRNSEVCALNLADLDFAHGVIHVRDSKTEAGIRQVNMTPWLRDELLAYRVTRPNAESTVPVRARRSGPAGVAAVERGRQADKRSKRRSAGRSRRRSARWPEERGTRKTSGGTREDEDEADSLGAAQRQQD
jgi:integrase